MTAQCQCGLDVETVEATAGLWLALSEELSLCDSCDSLALGEKLPSITDSHWLNEMNCWFPAFLCWTLTARRWQPSSSYGASELPCGQRHEGDCYATGALSLSWIPCPWRRKEQQATNRDSPWIPLISLPSCSSQIRFDQSRKQRDSQGMRKSPW
ncbi:hypothetical protein BJX66DRAFT_293216 [Aspergillus keveii]|uniref:Uncharacterized protein n=1 Tax=Aspergillus keveii TaxID=714993 RepID=A0ABR4GKL2_9EURO